EEHVVSVTSLARRILAARPFGAATWSFPTEPGSDELYTLAADIGTVEWLVDSVAATARGDLVLDTDLTARALTLTLTADELPAARPRRGLRTPRGFVLEDCDGRSRLSGTLRLQPGGRS